MDLSSNNHLATALGRVGKDSTPTQVQNFLKLLNLAASSLTVLEKEVTSSNPWPGSEFHPWSGQYGMLGYQHWARQFHLVSNAAYMSDAKGTVMMLASGFRIPWTESRTYWLYPHKRTESERIAYEAELGDWFCFAVIHLGRQVFIYDPSFHEVPLLPGLAAGVPAIDNNEIYFSDLSNTRLRMVVPLVTELEHVGGPIDKVFITGESAPLSLCREKTAQWIHDVTTSLCCDPDWNELSTGIRIQAPHEDTMVEAEN